VTPLSLLLNEQLGAPAFPYDATWYWISPKLTVSAIGEVRPTPGVTLKRASAGIKSLCFFPNQLVHSILIASEG
jgi:hypothetical protein